MSRKTVYRSQVIAILLLLIPYLLLAGETNIKVDLIGYKTNEKKFAIVTTVSDTFKVINAVTGKAVLSESLRGPYNDYDSGDMCYLADFSSVTEKGEYYIELPGRGRSEKFRIDDGIFNNAFYKVMRGFYLQRCGTEVRDPGGFSHGACHTQEAEFHPSAVDKGRLDVTGGWHDAGDYGKYIVNSGIATGTLLLMFERYKDKLKDFRLDIPESHNNMPDVLDEIKWNLDFMMKMQREHDGGVYHKVTTMRFPKLQLQPEHDTKPEYIYEITTTATGNFAAVMAIAARVFEPYDKQYSDKCLGAAKSAWTFLKFNKDMMPAIGFKNPPDTQTGQYGDGEDKDVRLWAAVELFTTTGDADYNKYFEDNYANWQPTVDGAAWWGDSHVLAMLSYVYSWRQNKGYGIAREIKIDLKRHADGLLERIQSNGYLYLLREDNYIWGSNSVALNYAINLLAAYDIISKAPDLNVDKDVINAYRQGALEVLHYMFGRNPFERSYVTGLGKYHVMNIHHRPSLADRIDEPYPGLIAGGPNRQRRDDVLRALPPNTPSAKCYADNFHSYASNEIAINWNAPLAYVLAAFTDNLVRVPAVEINY